MNLRQNQCEALPLQLPQARSNPARSRTGGLDLADAALLAFNYQLHDVRRDAPCVDAAQIEGLAQWLRELPAETAEATISLRMARAESLRRMLEDPDWSIPADMAQRGRRLLDYICRLDDLIPDDVPVIGHLDDALIVELSWAEFADEVNDYRHYCSYCRENPTRGSADDRRTTWESACLAEASEMLHRQQIRQRGYARPSPISRPFRVC